MKHNEQDTEQEKGNDDNHVAEADHVEEINENDKPAKRLLVKEKICEET